MEADSENEEEEDLLEIGGGNVERTETVPGER